MEKSQLQAKVQGPRCPFCHEDISPGEEAKTLCNDCMAVHHEACWEEHGGCSSCSFGSSREAPQRQPTLAQANALFDRQKPDLESLKGEAASLMMAGDFVTAAGVLFRAQKLDIEWKKGGELELLDFEIEDAAHKVLSKVGTDHLSRMILHTLLGVLTFICSLYFLPTSTAYDSNVMGWSIWFSVFILVPGITLFLLSRTSPTMYQQVRVTDEDPYYRSPSVHRNEIRLRFSGLLR